MNWSRIFFYYYRVYLYNIEYVINSTKNHDYGYILLSVYPG